MELLAVIGMHRSGTSLVAAALRARGFDVGPERDLMPPKPDNPRGFVEHMPAVRLNERVLRRLGGSWDAPPPLPPGWELDETVSDLRSEAAEIAETLLAHGEGPHLFKDPRMSLTLPLWVSVAPIRRAVLVLRPPDPVVRSLRARDPTMDVQGAAALYGTYLLGALHAPVPLEVVEPSEVLVDPDGALRRVIDRTSGLPPASQSTEDAVVPALWGRTSSEVESLEECEELDRARALHELVAGDAGAAWMARLGGLDVRSALAAMRDRHQTDVEDLAARVEALREARDRLLNERDTWRREADRLRDESHRIRHERDDARRLAHLRSDALNAALREAQDLRARLADPEGSPGTP